MKMLLYCTKAKPILSEVEYCYGDENKTKYECIPDTKKGNEYLEQMGFGEFLNGKIVVECDFEVEEIIYRETTEKNNYSFGTNSLSPDELLANTGLTTFELCQCIGTNENWIKGKYGYAIHIKNLHKFEKPKELAYSTCDNDAHYYSEKYDKKRKCKVGYAITKAPQNMMYATQYLGEPMYVENHYIGLDDYFEDYVLISIRPEGLCKILNGECTIIVRKRVLKGMLENDK